MMSADRLPRQLRRYFWLHAAGFCALLGSLAILEHEGFPRFWLGYLFLFTTIVMYAAIGVSSRTSDVDEYFVAGRRIPPLSLCPTLHTRQRCKTQFSPQVENTTRAGCHLSIQAHGTLHPSCLRKQNSPHAFPRAH